MRWLVLVGGLAALDAAAVMRPFEPDRSQPVVSPVQEQAALGRGKRREFDPGLAAVILSRPLFEPGRRRPGPVLAAAANPEGVPRLTGIVVAGSTRRALFAAPMGIARGEGDQVGAFTVTSIWDGAVEVAGPEGPRTLYPEADAGFRAQLAAAQPLAAMVGAEERERWVENDQ